MSEPFVGEIRMFGGNFAPRGFAFCDGQLLAVSQNDALFSLLGTIYGGDGRSTFGLPDLRGRVPVHRGQGPGLSDRRLGAKGGSERVSLIPGKTAAHRHTLMASAASASAGAGPAGSLLATASVALYGGASEGPPPLPAPVPDRPMHADAITPAVGGGQPHNNMAPYLCVNYIIALVGIYPSRS